MMTGEGGRDPKGGGEACLKYLLPWSYHGYWSQVVTALCLGSKGPEFNSCESFGGENRLSLLFPCRCFVRKTGSSLRASADLEVQLVQLNHCDGVYSNYWNTLLRNLKLSPYINFYVYIRPCRVVYLYCICYPVWLDSLECFNWSFWFGLPGIL